MYLRCLCFTILYLLFVQPLSAHVDEEFFQSYSTAKRCYAALDYAAAKATLEPLMNTDKNELSPYVLFYYALATYHNEESVLAEHTFAKLIAEFPGWVHQDEVHYWLGQLRFESQDYTAGLVFLAKIKSSHLKKAVKRMKTFFLGQLNETATLQTLLINHPQDRDIAQVLFDKLAKQPLIRRDFALMDSLARDFNLILKEYDLLQSLSSVKKESYNVAVFLPFFVDEIDYVAVDKNTLVITLYQGIKMAVAALNEQGIKINIFAYDTKKDPATTAALLRQKELKRMDLIIGPLTASTIPLVTEFAKRHKINVFNPLSENAEVVGNNPFVFLFKPSLTTQAKKAAELTLQNASLATANVGIIHGISAADTVRARTYQQYMEHRMGREVAFILPISSEEAQGFLHELRELTEKELVQEKESVQGNKLLELKKLTHIYVASEDILIATNVLSAVEMLKIKPFIIGHEQWLEKEALTLEQFQRLQPHLVAPDHIDYRREAIHDFRSRFYEQFAQYPNYYAYKGYDMMCFLGHMLDQHGVYFQKHWQTQFYPGTVFEGCTYGIHHDNQHVPILQLKKGQLVTCSQTNSDQ